MHAAVLRYFDHVARHGSIRKAADALAVASSAVNRQILRLEDEMGVALFERGRSGVRPTPAGELLFEDEQLRVLLVDEAGYPGFCRVIWRDHVREMSDLSRGDRLLLNDAVFHVEEAVREVMKPAKVNVASLGNVVPHLHWHVIARFDWDARWPAPVWAPRRCEVERDVPDAATRLAMPLDVLDAHLARAFETFRPAA